MAINNYSPDLYVVQVNGRVISDFGQTEPPVQHSPIDQNANLRRGQAGNGVVQFRDNPGREVNVYLNPGSADSRYMQSLINSKAVIEFSATPVGTGENAFGSEGVVINKAQIGRGGTTDAGVTDDQYTMQFNVWTET